MVGWLGQKTSAIDLCQLTNRNLFFSLLPVALAIFSPLHCQEITKISHSPKKLKVLRRLNIRI